MIVFGGLVVHIYTPKYISRVFLRAQPGPSPGRVEEPVGIIWDLNSFLAADGLGSGSGSLSPLPRLV